MTNLWRSSLLVFALALAGCGASDNLRYASDGVARVHAQMDNAQFNEIYAQADASLRAVTKQQEFLDFVGAVHRKLGKVQSASQRNYFVNFNTSGTQVRLNYQTKFEGGDAQEEFVWKIVGNTPMLVGYHINSMALVVK
jgi:hypothetical protein